MKYVVTLNGKNYEVEVEETDAVITAVTDAAPAAPAAATPVAPAAAPAAAAEGQKVLSPMPGTILSVNVNVGSSVKAGDILLILEAMKMENEIVAPCDGTVRQLTVQKGSTVATDALLAVVG
jgi:biotin carboxyl carrier protein